MRLARWWILGVAAAGLACGSARNQESPLGAASECASCHTAPGEGPPFRDRTGSTDTNRLTVGSHDIHLAPFTANQVACGSCHRVPRTIGDPGHLDAPPDQVVQFGGLALTGGAKPVWDGSGCAASYCHGNFPGGNGSYVPRWLPAARLDSIACGSCHGIPPGTGQHPFHAARGFDCTRCHGAFTSAVHVNGVKDIAAAAGWSAEPRTCANACHGLKPWE